MKRIFIDCSSGLSGDMVLGALIGLTDDPERTRKKIDALAARIDEMAGASDCHHRDYTHFHRSYNRVIEIIEGLGLDAETESIAKNIYRVIGVAESKVHGSSLDDLHFHEVGRNQAIANIAGVALCIGEIGPYEVIYEEICDGTGTVECAHGTLSVPVPAVKAMLDEYSVSYVQTDQEGEMVTPSGLAMIIGIGAKQGKRPEGEPVRVAEAVGTRNAGGNGLRAYLFVE